MAAAILVLAACSPSRPAPDPSPSIIASGCGSSPLLKGAQPTWLVDAGSHNNPDIVYAVASPAIAAGFLFGYPLTAGRTNPTNKILWVVGKPRKGSALELTVHPADAAAPTLRQSLEPNSGPGEIYPSIVDVPSAGCWRFELQWAGNRAAIDFKYL